MDREILFRGKRVDNNEWMHGDLIQKKNGTRQIYSEKELDGYKETFFDIFKVIPETVGQFTGQTDKNGVKIFEGDVFFVYGEYDNGLCVLDNSGYMYVGYNEKEACYCMMQDGEYFDMLVDYLDEDSEEDARERVVISNIHEKEVE